MEFKALFWKGDLKELTLTESNSTDNGDRIKAQAKFKKHIERVTARKEKRWFKLYTAYGRVVSLVFSTARYLLGSLMNLTIRIERWITIN
jgi:hypothetical protein